MSDLITDAPDPAIPSAQRTVGRCEYQTVFYNQPREGKGYDASDGIDNNIIIIIISPMRETRYLFDRCSQPVVPLLSWMLQSVM